MTCSLWISVGVNDTLVVFVCPFETGNNPPLRACQRCLMLQWESFLKHLLFMLQLYYRTFRLKTCRLWEEFRFTSSKPFEQKLQINISENIKILGCIFKDVITCTWRGAAVAWQKESGVETWFCVGRALGPASLGPYPSCLTLDVSYLIFKFWIKEGKNKRTFLQCLLCAKHCSGYFYTTLKKTFSDPVMNRIHCFITLVL